ncbi:restriction endonuclease subunit S [Streptomyces toxytricini]|uniref:Restriction endonuclease subunit S n=1 Tax=Streptomyces toxytricini TaxID=67369 RepID=A0ABW8EDL2_STRT5
MPEWTRTTLDRLVKLRRGHDLPATSRNPGNVPVVGAAGPNGFHDTAIAKAPGVVVGRAGASMGHATYCAEDFWPLNTSLYVTDFLGNDPRFVYHLLGGIDFSGYNSGAAQPMLNRNYITQIPISLPEPDEQRAIAAVLGALDDKIAVNERIAATVDDLAAALFEDLLTADSEGAAVLLGDVADVNLRTVKAQDSGSLRYVDISSVGVGAYEWPEEMPWSDAPGRARRKAALGDTIWSTVRPNRRSHALVLDTDPGLVFSTGLAVISPKTVGPAFLYESTRLASFQTYLESVAEGSAYPAVRADRFKGAPIILPPEDARFRFEEMAMPMRLRAHQAQVESRTLATLRDTLLPQLMSGRLRVKDAEKIVEDHV